MFHFLFRLICGLVAAAVAAFGVLVIGAAVFGGAPPDAVIGWLTFVLFIPGDWEEELHRLSEEAEKVKHEREKDRFGLE